MSQRRRFGRTQAGAVTLSAAALLAASAWTSSAPFPGGCGPGWKIVPSQAVPQQNTGFAAVTAVPGGGGWAVGTPAAATTYADRGYRPLVEAWTGAGWRITPSPAVTSRTELLGVAARSSTEAWAVGDARPTPLSYHYRAVLERWNGQRWATVAVPTIGNGANSLQAVATGPGGTAWAVGWYVSRGVELPLVLSYRAGKWKVVPSPAVSNGQLHGVAVAADGTVWAVGGTEPAPSTGLSGLIEHLVGGRWVRMAAPVNTVLNAVTAIPGGDVWAVGTVAPSPQPLLLRHHHGRWTTIPSPHIDAYGELNAVTARSATDVWAAGSAYSVHGQGPRRSLIEHWNGSTVSVVANPSEGRPYLSGVAALSDGSVLAVGGQHPSGRHPRYQTYAEARCGS